MSAPVDVLTVMDRLQSDWRDESQIVGRWDSADDLAAVRAAFAELIEADRAYDDARRKWSGEKYEGDDYGVPGSDFMRCLCCEGESGAGTLNRGVTHEPDCEVAALESAESRRSATLARVKGA